MPTKKFTTRDIFSQFRGTKPPSLGDMREPLSFYRSRRVPKVAEDGSETTEFTQEITPYANVWGKVVKMQGNYLGGQNVENDISHVFVIRTPVEFKIEQRDYCVFRGANLSIRGVMAVQDGTEFVTVLCDEVGRFAEEPRDDTTTPEDESKLPPPEEDANPLWR